MYKFKESICIFDKAHHHLTWTSFDVWCLKFHPGEKEKSAFSSTHSGPFMVYESFRKASGSLLLLSFINSFFFSFIPCDNLYSHCRPSHTVPSSHNPVAASFIVVLHSFKSMVYIAKHFDNLNIFSFLFSLVTVNRIYLSCGQNKNPWIFG